MASPLRERLERETRALLREIATLARAMLDPDTPWLARAIVFLVVAYVVSPIDLIPDFIPVLGWLDELLLVPLALRFAMRLVPAEVLDRHRAGGTARELPAALRYSGAVLIGGVWALLAYCAYLMLDGMAATG